MEDDSGSHVPPPPDILKKLDTELTEGYDDKFKKLDESLRKPPASPDEILGEVNTIQGVDHDTAKDDPDGDQL